MLDEDERVDRYLVDEASGKGDALAMFHEGTTETLSDPVGSRYSINRACRERDLMANIVGLRWILRVARRGVRQPEFIALRLRADRSKKIMGTCHC